MTTRNYDLSTYPFRDVSSPRNKLQNQTLHKGAMVIQDIHLKIDHQKHHPLHPRWLRVSLTCHQNGEMDLKPWRRNLELLTRDGYILFPPTVLAAKKNRVMERDWKLNSNHVMLGGQKKATDV